MADIHESLSDIKAAIEVVPSLRNGGPFSKQHTRWLTTTLSVLEDAFSRKSRYYSTFAQFTWRFHGSTIITTFEILEHGHPDGVMASRDYDAFLSQLETAEGLLEAALDELKRSAKRARKSTKDTPCTLKMAANAKYNVFLSYAADDSGLATELHDELKKKRISCFMAEKDVAVATEWQDAIRDALRSASRILLLLTPRSLDRPWVLMETGAAWALDIPIVPALVHVTPDQLPDPVRRYQARIIETTAQRRGLIRELKAASAVAPDPSSGVGSAINVNSSGSLNRVVSA